MADETLKAQVVVDASGVAQGMEQASTIVKSTVAAIQSDMKNLGISAQEAANELLKAGFDATTVAKALQLIAPAAVPADGALKEVKKSADQASRSLGQLTTTMAYGSARIGAYAGGLGMMGFPLARIATQFSGLSTILATAFPVLLIGVAADAVYNLYEKFAKMGDELRKNQIAWGDFGVSVAEEADKLSLSNVKTQEQISILEGHPSPNRTKEEIIQTRVESEKLAKTLQDVAAKANDLLEQKGVGRFAGFFADQASTADIESKLKAPLRELEAAQTSVQLAIVKGDKAQITSAQALAEAKREAVIAIINSIRQQDKAEFESHERAMRAQVLSPYNPAADEAYLTSRKNVLDILELSLSKMKEIKAEGEAGAKLTGQLEAAKDAKRLADDLRASKNAGDELTNAEQRVKNKLDEAAKSAKELADAHTLFGAEKGGKGTEDQLSQLQEISAAEQKFNQQSKQLAQEAADFQINQQIRTWQERLALGQVSAGQEAAAVDALIQKRLASDKAAVEAEIKIVESRLQAERATDAKGYAQDLNLYAEYLKKKQQLEQQAAIQMENTNKTAMQILQQGAARAIDKVGEDFSRGFTSWMNGQESFGRAMQKVWTNIADTVVSSLIKVGLQMIAQLALQQALDKASQLSSAKKAAGGVYASASEIPIIGPFIAPVLAAAAFATVISFDKGGLMPETGMAMLHKNEMVLPPNISSAVQNAAAGGGMGAPQINYHPTIHTSDASTHDILRSHSTQLRSMLTREMRRMNR